MPDSPELLDTIDVIGLLDNSGELVVKYKYAWGKAIATIGTFAATLGKYNPFRYRGYVYDEELGMYYLRYYSPYYCRFLVIDSYLAGASGDALNHNGYVYCGNKPVSRSDDGGDWFITCLIGVAVSIAFEYAGDVIENFKKGKRGVDAFVPDSPVRDYIAAGVGGFIAAVPYGNYVVTAGFGALSNVADKLIRGKVNGIGDVIEYALVGGYSNAAGRYVSESLAWRKLTKITHENRATRKMYARTIYGGGNRYINDNLRKLAGESAESFTNRFARYATYSAFASTFSVSVVLAD